MNEHQSTYRQITKATTLFGGVQAFQIIITIVKSKLVAILLGPTGMGIVGLLTSTTGLITGLTNFGLGTSAVKDISEGLYRASVGAVVNGEIMGMSDIIEEGGDFKVVKFDDEEGKEIFWHTSSHVMAFAIQNLFPDAKFAIGPAIGAGFYYDIDTEHRFVPEDLPVIEEEMAKKKLTGRGSE